MTPVPIFTLTESIALSILAALAIAAAVSIAGLLNE